jgi:hypothetical protein
MVAYKRKQLNYYIQYTTTSGGQWAVCLGVNAPKFKVIGYFDEYKDAEEVWKRLQFA